MRYTPGDTASEDTVTLGDESVTAPIDPTLGEPGFVESGTATVTLTVSAELEGAHELNFTTDADTDISMPVGIAAAETDDYNGGNDNNERQRR